MEQFHNGFLDPCHYMACDPSTGYCTSERFEFLWFQKGIDLFFYRSYENVFIFTHNGNP